MPAFHCAAPWRGLHITPGGIVKTCCAGDPSMGGNLNQNTIQEILNSDIMRDIRTSISQGRAHPYCSVCVAGEPFGADGERQWHNKSNAGFDYATAGDQYHYPVIMDVRWNNTCNLSCNYCDERHSSKWSALKGIPFKSGTRPYYEQVTDFLEQHREHITQVALVGGEPLLLAENQRLLEVIPESAMVTVITNLSIDLSKNRIFQLLAKRSKVGWSISFENVGERFEYVRYGSQWSLLQQNLNSIKSLLAQGHFGGVHAVYNIYSATRIREFKDFTNDQGLQVVWQKLMQPNSLDPFQHGPAVTEPAVREIQAFYSSYQVTPAEKTFFDTAMANYRTPPDNGSSMARKLVKRHIEPIENQYHADRKGDFRRLWPEYEGIFEI